MTVASPFVSEVGSDAWIDAYAEAVAGVDGGDVEVSVRHQIIDGPAWMVTVSGGQVSVRSSPEAEPAHVTFTWEREDAEAVARGETGPLAVFQAGRLRVGGDLHRLVEVAEVFSRFPAVQH